MKNIVVNFEAVDNTVIIDEENQPEKTRTGIYYPPSNARHRRRSIGVVVSIGDEVKTTKVGDVVAIGRYAGAYMEHGGKEYTAVKETEVLGTIEGDPLLIEIGDTTGYMQHIDEAII